MPRSDRGIRFGVMAPFVDGLITSGSFMRDYARLVEACGADSLWTVEHVIVAEHYEPLYPYSASGQMATAPGVVPMPAPLEVLSFVAAVTTTLKLGTAMMVAPLHRPAVLAKQAATIERLSGGRLLLGLGIGWQKEEYAAVGVPYSDRGARLDDCIAAMRALWGDQPASYSGRFVSFDDVHSVPQPSRPVPIVLGGNSEAAIRRAGRVGDGWFPFTASPEVFRDGAAMLRDEMLGAGRDPDALEITAWPGSCDPTTETDLDVVGRYVDAGASRLIVLPRITRPDGLAAVEEQLIRYRDEVIARL